MVERIDVSTLRIRIPPDYLDNDMRTPMGGYSKVTLQNSPIYASFMNQYARITEPDPDPEPDTIHNPYTIGQFSYCAINNVDISDIPHPASAPRAVFEVVIPKRDIHTHPVQTRPPQRSKSACDLPPHPLARPPLHPTHPTQRPPEINHRRTTTTSTSTTTTTSTPTAPLPLLSAIDLHAGNIAILIEAEISEYLTAIVSIMREYRVEISGNKLDPYNNTICYPDTLTASALNCRIHHTCTYMYNMEYFSYLYAIGLDLRNYKFNSFISTEIHGIVIKDVKHPSEVCFYKYTTPKKITIQELCELIYRAFPKYATNTTIQVVGSHVHRDIMFIKAYVDN